MKITTRHGQAPGWKHPDEAKCWAKVLLWTLLLLTTAMSSVRADWINLTGAQNAPNIAEFHVDEERVRLVLEIYVNDLATFVGLVPDEFLSDHGLKAPPFTERIRRFSQEDFQIITENGEKLQAELKKFEPRSRKERPFPFAGAVNPTTGRPIPGPPKDKRVCPPKTGPGSELVYSKSWAELGGQDEATMPYLPSQ